MRRLLGLVLATALVLAACGSEESREGGTVSEEVEEQLAYLEPDSALVVAVDMRYEEENWESLRGIADRVLAETREVVDPDDRDGVPADADAALDEFTRFVSLDFDDDVRPLLAGRLVIGEALPPGQGDPQERVTLVFRTEEGDLRAALEKALDNSKLRPMRGHDDVLVAEEAIALVGDDTLVVADGTEQLTAAVERAEAGRGFPPELLAAAEESVGIDDPFVLATGTLDLAREFLEEENLERAVAAVPYLAAVERVDVALDLSEDAVEASAHVATTGAELSEDDLPLGPAGEVELPVVEDAVVGGSRDQSRITTFAAQVMRSAFADSDFVATVEETERELGIRFEDEVLRQFNCPSVSSFEPDPDAPLGVGGRFSARSCVSDPERMRELLPELAPRLPRILRAMGGLGGEGLFGLLMLAPDAPLAPGTMLMQIGVAPLGGGGQEELLYEVSGLRDEPGFGSADRVVFGMIGDVFVVGSDRQAAREAATLETEPAGEDAASSLRVWPRALAGELGPEAGEVLDRAFADFEIGFSADPRATRAHAVMPLAD
ncbi:MAG TPA: hypothetical protein VE289_10610 [Gaiellaceae bacterium]|nr:hypothetical protein [Gaiellaceae bacterium]